MPTITLSVRSDISTKQSLSIQDLKERYLFGLRIVKDGKELPDSVYQFFIEAAKKEVERYLSIKLDLQIFKENRDFQIVDWLEWNQIKCTFPIVTPISLTGNFGNVKQVDFPLPWLSTRKTSDDETYSRLMHVVPNTGSSGGIAAIYVGVLPNSGNIGGGRRTPEYWTVQYVTGFKQLPIDIEQAIGMLASLNVLTVGNETLASAMGTLGASSKSLSIDGLSQSVSMYVNGTAGIFGARIKQYNETLLGVGGRPGLLDRLRDYYGAMIWSVA